MIEMKYEEISRKLREAAQKMSNDNNIYKVREELTVGRGEGNYKLYFEAKKKGGFGLFGAIKAIADVATGALYGGAEGAFWRAIGVAERTAYRSSFEPIEREMKGTDIAAILNRWAETIPQGFLETIGSDLVLPDDPKWFSMTLKPGKEIKITVDFVKLRSEVEAKKELEEKVDEAISKIKEEMPKIPVSQQTPPVVPTIPPMLKDMVLSSIGNLYAEGTLTNIDNGFKLTLDNINTDVGIVAPIKLTVDGVEIDINKVKLKIGNKVYDSSSISLSSPVIFKKGEKADIIVEGITLPPGNHRIDIETSLQGIGKVNLTVLDSI